MAHFARGIPSDSAHSCLVFLLLGSGACWPFLGPAQSTLSCVWLEVDISSGAAAFDLLFVGCIDLVFFPTATGSASPPVALRYLCSTFFVSLRFIYRTGGGFLYSIYFRY